MNISICCFISDLIGRLHVIGGNKLKVGPSKWSGASIRYSTETSLASSWAMLQSGLTSRGEHVLGSSIVTSNSLPLTAA